MGTPMGQVLIIVYQVPMPYAFSKGGSCYNIFVVTGMIRLF